MRTCTGSLARVGKVVSRLGLWLGGMSLLLLCSSCAVAHISRAAAVQDMGSSSETAVLGPEDILRRGEAYYHFMRSYASLRGSAEDRQLDEAIAELRAAIEVAAEDRLSAHGIGSPPDAPRGCASGLASMPKSAPSRSKVSAGVPCAGSAACQFAT